jgi:HAD superfamily hydrolase (TIGR01484 family)
MKRGIIFTDVDGTLVFHEELHGIEKLSTENDNTVKVRDPKEGTIHSAYDISNEMYKVFFDVETKKLCERIHESYDIVFVSGARKSTMDSRVGIMNFSDAYILENGGMILGKDFKEDGEWNNILAPQKESLAATKNYLQSLGWTLDVKGRTAALRVRLKDNKARSQEDFNNLIENLVLPKELKSTINIGHLDIILADAGKDNAVRYLMQKLNYKQAQSIGIGDDINDLDMLDMTGKKYVLGSAYPEAIQLAINRKWYVSKAKHFNGINEILRNIGGNANEYN